MPAGALADKPGIRLTDPDTKVLDQGCAGPRLTLHEFGKGKAVYMSGFQYSPAAARMLLELLLYLTGKDAAEAGVCEDSRVEVAWFPASATLVMMNNAEAPVDAVVRCPAGERRVQLAPLEMQFCALEK